MKTKKNRMFRLTLVSLALILSIFLAACGGGAAEAPSEAAPTSGEAAPTGAAAAPTTAAGNATGGTWLIMMYQDADDSTLERDIVTDVNEAELVGSTDQVKIVAQLDRFKGAYDGEGDWTSTRRYLLTQDSDLNQINSPVLEDLGEVNMGTQAALIDFATWAIATYPADHYVLILSDHGAGWQGGYHDPDPVEGSNLRMQDIDDALGTIIAKTGIGTFELVGFDACLMGQLEVMSAIAPHAKYAIGSEETEPSLGWAYSKFLQALNDNTAMTGGQLGQAVVDSYIAQDIRITDDKARSIFTGGDFSAESVAADLVKGVTLTAVDLGAIQNLNAAVNELAVALTKVDQSKVAEARAYAQAYTSVFGKETPPSFIDLGHFLELLLKNIADPGVQQAAQQVQSALKQAVVAEKHGDQKPASTGLTIYFPNSGLYQGTYGASSSMQYSAYVGRFAAASLWDDFLTFHYTGAAFEPTAFDLAVLTPAQSAQADFTQAVAESAPETGAEVVPPGGGQITIAPLSASAEEIGPEGSMTLSTEITGANIGYIYIDVFYYDEESKSYLSADKDFIFAETTKETGGVFYPDWGEGTAFPLEYEWTPALWYMSDGNEANDQRALFSPEVYGQDESGDIYTVRGVYKFTEDGTEIQSIMTFGGDGTMQSIFGFTGENYSGAAHEITPQPGDTFTILDEWLEFDKNPDGELVDYLGGTMTFGETPFKFVQYNAYPGQYILGITVEDLNGNTNSEYISVNVTQ